MALNSLKVNHSELLILSVSNIIKGLLTISIEVLELL